MTRTPKPFEQQVLHVASLVRDGEWGTFGDVSIVVTGNNRSARRVGAIVREYGVEPHSRLLRGGGRVPSNYLPEATSVAGDDQAPEPEKLQSWLEAEGVRFIGRRADPHAYVGADVLRERLRTNPYPGA